MDIYLTREELYNILLEMTVNETIEFFEQNGMTLLEKSHAIRGIYRRELGADLIYADGKGNWTRVSLNSDDETRRITWACFGKEDWWIRVLDENNEVVFNGDKILMDANGNQVG